MILIADGGSTKADWILLNKSTGEQILKTRTKGLNPAVFGSEMLRTRLTENTELQQYKDAVTEVYFYGAGCGTERPALALQQLFQSYFTNAIVDVKEDTYAAAFGATTEPGIICILGTGSNSSYFDGKDVHTIVPSLGYILMDEASGNYFGKRLICDYYYKKMPENLRLEFESKFDLEADTIKANIYKKENPNAYLAVFAEFILRNERNEYFNNVLEEGITEFFTKRIMIYKNFQEVPVHFVGSIAFFSSDIIHKVAKQFNATVGNIVRRPIDGLIDYHRAKLQEA